MIKWLGIAGVIFMGGAAMAYGMFGLHATAGKSGVVLGADLSRTTVCLFYGIGKNL